jgi:hypothetical protein
LTLGSRKEEPSLKKTLVLLSAMLLSVPTVAFAGPFGFRYGESRAEVIAEIGQSHVIDSDEDSLTLNTAPRPHPDFEAYYVAFSPTKGLLKIIAYGKNIDTNQFGDRLQGSFKSTVKSLTEIYGTASIDMDDLESGSMWDQPKDWMQSLLSHDRKFCKSWHGGPTIRSEHLIGIHLDARVWKGTSTGFLTLIYEFDGWEAQSAAIHARKDSVF